uniref:Uncharacterized protein n=1 Tax=Acrobeloides nanus TaxID=290746 RepID=A0A914EMN0_9BILA
MEFELLVGGQRNPHPITRYPSDPSFCYEWTRNGRKKKYRRFACKACRAKRDKGEDIKVPELKADLEKDIWLSIRPHCPHSCSPKLIKSAKDVNDEEAVAGDNVMEVDKVLTKSNK